MAMADVVSTEWIFDQVITSELVFVELEVVQLASAQVREDQGDRPENR